MKKLIIFCLLFLMQHAMFAQNYKFQALFIYNIAQLIEWPEVNENFVIGVVGAKPLSKELQGISDKHKLFGNTIVVKNLVASELISEGCHLVYISRSSSNKLDLVLDGINSKPILLVADKPGLTDAGINFIDNTEKIEFEVFPTIIKSSQLKISNSLLSLGTVK